MKRVLAFLLVAACGGPSHDQLVETPSATNYRPSAEAPPASTSDKDRERLIQSFDDMQTTQRAYREAEGSQQQTPPNQPLQGQPAPPKKKGVAEQAPPEPKKKKKGVAEQAPPEPKKKGVAEQAPPEPK